VPEPSTTPEQGRGDPVLAPVHLEGDPHLAFQPLVDLGDGALIGFEALLRWRHPTEGVMPPTEVLSRAEADGDLGPVTRWVLEEGCTRAAKWPETLQLSVNVSVAQLRAGLVWSATREALALAGLAPHRLTLEVPDLALTDPAAREDLGRLARAGILLGVDDVGAGGGSVGILADLGVATVKVDRAFVANLEPEEGINRTVVETAVRLAHSAGMSAVAAGVETAHQARVVAELGCDAAQGYYFAPPLNPARAADLAARAEHRFDLGRPPGGGPDHLASRARHRAKEGPGAGPPAPA
jgi:EAL domain-containing protein (putative c-di-GMP-specific phosphodiesterase class I)